MRVHATITSDRIKEACIRRETSRDRPGLCIECGAEQDDCEPDDMNLECRTCGESGVYGSDELALRQIFDIQV